MATATVAGSIAVVPPMANSRLKAAADAMTGVSGRFYHFSTP